MSDAHADTRLRAAQGAVAIHSANTASRAGSGIEVSDDEVLTDLLTDLRHWAVDKGVDYEACESSACNHFRAER